VQVGRDTIAAIAACPAAGFRIFAMALLPILEFPDPRLRTQAAAVDPADLATPVFQTLIDDMFQTMYEAPGIGLAASQVDVHKRFMVIDVTEDRSRPLVFINPVITAREGEQVYQEGCLSVPGIYADVTRSDTITVEALDRHGQPFSLEADGVLAVCIQHEMDHLLGKLFVDYLSPLKREMVRKKLLKAKRAA
jgi:peptide deformylase